MWDCALDEQRLTLRLSSPDGDQGYPGAVEVTVTYELNDDNELVIEYTATSSKATPINLTNHSYFNLGGHVSSDLHCQLWVTLYRSFSEILSE